MLQLANWIEFPKMGIHLDVDREITIGSFSIKWYGVLIALGMILAVIYALYRCKKDYKINTDHFLDVIIGAVIFGIIGARLYYVIFSWDQYKDKEDRRDDASREETAHKVAWAAVKHEYAKGDDDKWHKKS